MAKQNSTEPNQALSEIRHSFLMLSRQLGFLQKESSQCCGVTKIQSHIPYEIKHTHHMSLNELAERLVLDSSTTSRHVQGRVEQGFVQRHPDPKDRRYVTLGLTEQGIMQGDKINQMMSAYLVDIFDQLPEGKLETMSTEFKLLLDAMGKSKYCCKPPF